VSKAYLVALLKPDGTYDLDVFSMHDPTVLPNDGFTAVVLDSQTRDDYSEALNNLAHFAASAAPAWFLEKLTGSFKRKVDEMRLKLGLPVATAKESRPSWERYFMSIAKVVASRGTCDRKRVGCVIVKDKMLLATGYNGSVRGAPHCDDVGHDMEDGHCVRTVHAEVNAVAQAAKRGESLDGAVAFVTCAPWWGCTKMLLNAGINSIVYDEAYRLDPRLAGFPVFRIGSFK
jgi:dCMP deaminase